MIKNDVLENSIDPVRHFNCLLYLLLFDDLSIITRLAASSSSVLSNCLGSKGIPLRSQAFSIISQFMILWKDRSM